MSPRSLQPFAAVVVVCRREMSRLSVLGRAVAVCVACLIAAAASHDATAALVIDPSGGTLLTDGTGLYEPKKSDAAIRIPLTSTFNGKFSGQTAEATIYASDNGNLTFTPEGGPNIGGNIFYFYPNRKNTVARISPLWDDFLFAQDEDGNVDNRIVWEHRQGSFLAVTWLNVRLENETVAGGSFPDTDRSFQLLWFEADTQIRGFDFKADDIVFSYVAHVAGTADFGELYGRVALDKGDGDGNDSYGTTAFPAFSDFGDVFADDGENFPGRNDDFLLFRWDSEIGNYDVSIQSFTAVPEPSSMVLLATIAVGGLASASRRRQRNAASTEPI